MSNKPQDDYEAERDAFAKMLAASGISNEDFHAALEQFDRENKDEGDCVSY